MVVLLRRFAGPTALVEVNGSALQFVVPADRVEWECMFSFVDHPRLFVNQFVHKPIAVSLMSCFGQEIFGVGVRGQMLEAWWSERRSMGRPVSEA